MGLSPTPWDPPSRAALLATGSHFKTSSLSLYQDSVTEASKAVSNLKKHKHSDLISKSQLTPLYRIRIILKNELNRLPDAAFKMRCRPSRVLPDWGNPFTALFSDSALTSTFGIIGGVYLWGWNGLRRLYTKLKIPKRVAAVVVWRSCSIVAHFEKAKEELVFFET